MKLNFSIKIPQKEVQQLLNLTLATHSPEFSYEITEDKKETTLSEITDIQKIIGITNQQQFPNKLKSMYEDQIIKLKNISLTMCNEIEVTRIWFDQIKNGFLQTEKTETEKFKSMYQMLESELKNLKNSNQLQIKNTPEEADFPSEVKRLKEKVALLESELRIKDARIASLLSVEEQVTKLEYEKQNYQSELLLLKTKMNDPRLNYGVQRTRTIQQTTVTESISKAPQFDAMNNIQNQKNQNLLMMELNEALSDLKNYRTKCQTLEIEMSELKQNEQFLNIKTEEVIKFKKLLDEQNTQILTQNKRIDETVKMNERLNKKLSDLKTYNAQVVAAHEVSSDKNKKLSSHIEYLERLCLEAKLKNEALIKKIHELEEDTNTAFESVDERATSASNNVSTNNQLRDKELANMNIFKKQQEDQIVAQKLEDARRQANDLTIKLNLQIDVDRQKDLVISNFNADVQILNEKLKTLNLKNEELLKKINAFGAEVVEKDKKIKNLDTKILTLMEEIDRLKKELLGEKKKAKDFQTEREKVEHEKNRLANDLHSVEVNLKTAKETILQSRVKENGLQSEKDVFDRQVKKVEAQLKLIEKEKETLIADRERFSGENAGLLAEKQKLKNENEDNFEKMGKFKKDLDHLEQNQKVSTERIETLNLELENEKNERKQVEEQVLKQKDEIEALLKEKADFLQIIEGLKVEMERLNVELGDLKAIIKSNNLKISEYEEINKNLSGRIDQLVLENSGLRTEVQKLGDKLAIKNDDHVQTLNALSSLEHSFANLTKQMDNLRNDNAKNMFELNSKNEELTRQNQALNLLNGELQKQVIASENKYKEMRSENDDKIHNLQSVSAQLKIEKAALDSDNLLLKRRLEQLMAELQAKETQFSEEMDSTKNELEKEIDELTAKLNQNELETLNLMSENQNLKQKNELVEAELTVRTKNIDTNQPKPTQNNVLTSEISEKLKNYGKLRDENKLLKSQLEGQKRRFDLLEKDLKNKVSQIQALSIISPDILTPQLREKLAKVSQLQNDMNLIGNENEQLKRQNQLLTFEVQEKEKQLSIANSKVCPINVIDRKEHLTALGKLNNANEILKNENENVRRQLQDLINKSEQLKRQTQSEKDASESEKIKLNKSIEDLRKNMFKLQSEIESLLKQIKQLENNNRQIAFENNELMTKLNSFAEELQAENLKQIGTLGLKVKDLENKIEFSESEKKSLNQLVDFLKNQVNELQKEPPKWEAVPSIELSDKIKAELNNLEKFKRIIADNESQVEVLKRKLLFAEKELEVKNKKIADLGELTDPFSQMKKSDHLRILSQLEEDKLKTDLANASLLRQVDLLSRSVEEKNNAIEVLSKKIQDLLDGEIKDLNDLLRNAKKDVANSDIQKESLSRQIEILMDEIRGYQGKIKNLNDLIGSLEDKNNQTIREKIEIESKLRYYDQNTDPTSQTNAPIITEVVTLKPKSRKAERNKETKVSANAPGEEQEQPDLMAEVYISPSDFVSVQSENSLLNRRMREVQNSSEDKIRDLVRKLNILQKKNEDELKDKDDKIADLKARLFKMQKENENVNDVSEQLPIQNSLFIKNQPSKDSVPKDLYDKCAKECQSAQQTSDDFKGKNEFLENQIKNLGKKVESLEDLNLRLSAQLRNQQEVNEPSNQQTEINITGQTNNLIKEKNSESIKTGDVNNAQNKTPENVSSELARLRRSVELSDANIAEKDSQISQLKALINGLNEQISTQASSLAKTAAQNNDLENEFGKLKGLVQNQNLEVNTLKSRIDELEAELKAKTDKILKLNGDLVKSGRDLDGLVYDKEQLTSANGALSASLDIKDKEIADLKAEMNKIKEINSQLLSELNNLKAKLENNQNSPNLINDELVVFQKKFEEKLKEFDVLGAKYQEAHLLIMQLKNNKEDQERAQTQNELENKKLLEDQANMNKENQDLKLKLRGQGDLERKMNETSDREKTLKTDCSNLETEITKLKNVIRTYEVKRTSIVKTADNVSGKGLNDNSEQINVLIPENEEMEQEIEKLNQLLAQNDSKMLEQNTLLQNANKELENLKKDSTLFGQENNELKNQVDVLRAQNQKITIKSNSQEEMIEGLEKRIKNLEDEEKRLKEQLLKANDNLKNINSDLFEKQKKLLELQQKTGLSLKVDFQQNSENVQNDKNEQEENIEDQKSVNLLKAENRNLKDYLKKKQIEADQIKKQFDDLKKSFDNLFDEERKKIDKLNEQEVKLGNQQIQIDKIKSDIKTLEDELQKRNNQIQILEVALKDKLKQFEEIENENIGLKNKNSHLELEIETLNFNLDESPKQSNEKQIVEKDVSQKQIVEKQKESESSSNNISTNTQNKKSSNKNVEDDLKKAQLKISDLEKDIKGMNDQIANLKADLNKSALQEEILANKSQELEKKYEDIQKEDSRTNGLLIFFEQLKSELQKKEDIETNSNKLMIEIGFLKGKLSSMEEMLEAKNKEVDRLKNEKEDLEKQAKDNSDSLLNAVNEIKQMNSDGQIKDMRIKSLEDELAIKNHFESGNCEKPKMQEGLDLDLQLSPFGALKSEFNDAKLVIEKLGKTINMLEGELENERKKALDLDKKNQELKKNESINVSKISELSSIQNKLKVDLEKSIFDVKKLTDMIEKLNLELKESQKEVQQNVQQLLQNRSEIDGLKAKLRNAQNERDEARNEINEWKKEVDQIGEENSKKSREKRNLEEENTKLKSEFELAIKKAAGFEEMFNQMKKQVQSLRAEINIQQLVVFAKDKEIEEGKENGFQLLENIENIKNQLALMKELEKERKNNDNIFDNSIISFRHPHIHEGVTSEPKEEIVEREGPVNNQNQEHFDNDLKEQLQTANGTIAQLDRKLKDIQLNMKQYLKENGELKSKIQTLEFELKNLNNEYVLKSKNLEVGNGNVVLLGTQLRQKNQALKQLELDLSAIKDENKQMTVKLSQFNANYESVSKSTNVQSVKNTSVNTSVLNIDWSEQTAAFTKLNNDLNALRRENEDLNTRLKDSEDQNKRSLMKVNLANQLGEQLNQTVQEKVAMIRKLNDDNTKLRAENEVLKVKLRSITNDSTNFKNQVEGLLKEISLLQSELGEKKAEIDDLKEEIARFGQGFTVINNQKLTTSHSNEQTNNQKKAESGIFQEALLQKIQEKDFEIDNLNKNLFSLKKEFEALKRVNANLSENHRENEKKTSLSDGRFNDLANQLKQKGEKEKQQLEEMSKLKSENELLKFKMETLQKDLDSQAIILKTKSSVVRSQSQVNSSKDRQTTSSSSSEITLIRSENETLRRKIRTFEEELSSKQGEIDGLMRKIKSLNTEVSLLKSDQIDVQEFEKLKQKILLLESDLSFERNKFNENARSSASYELKIKSLLMEIENFKRNKDHMEEELESKSRDIISLKQDMLKKDKQIILLQQSN